MYRKDNKYSKVLAVCDSSVLFRFKGLVIILSLQYHSSHPSSFFPFILASYHLSVSSSLPFFISPIFISSSLLCIFPPSVRSFLSPPPLLLHSLSNVDEDNHLPITLHITMPINVNQKVLALRGINSIR